MAVRRYSNHHRKRFFKGSGFKKFAAVGSLFWFMIWAASGFDGDAMWPLMFFAIAPWILFSGKGKGQDEDYEIGEEVEQKSALTMNAPALAAPAPAAPINLALHRQLIEDSKIDVTNIRAAANTASGELGENLRSMASNLDKIERDLLEEPAKLSQVQRLYSYYLPSCSDILSARGKAIAANDTTKIAEIDAMISRLSVAFNDFALRMHGEDARSIEIDIKLLEQSLADEFGFVRK